jgi:PIN domain nuclease of toxin-antitoxin system
MKLLLDTSIFIFFITDSTRLNEETYSLIQVPGNEAFLSIASLWEVVIKYQLRKLPLPKPAHIYLPEERRKHQIGSLGIDEGAISRLAELPNHHKDPFDRILIAQALEHGMTILTHDPLIRMYSVPCMG